MILFIIIFSFFLQFEVWMYNISETRLRTLKAQLSSLVKWQRTRVGFLHQLLSQKVGLFHHTTGKDIAPSVQLANQYCTTPQNVATLVKQSKPPIEEVVSEILQRFCSFSNLAKFPFRIMDYSPWGSKNRIEKIKTHIICTLFLFYF